MSKLFIERYQQRSFDDYFYIHNSTLILKHLPVDELNQFYYPGSSYTCIMWVRYCGHPISVQCAHCYGPYDKIHPLLYIPDVQIHSHSLTLAYSFDLMKKYVHGTWWLYLNFFPILPELKKKIYYMLAYLMFFHPNYRFRFSPSKEVLQQRLSPLYQLTQGFQEEKK